jgi:hypothetical protein
MTNDHATITAIPPRPDFDDDLTDAGQEPWVTTAAELLAYLLADGADVEAAKFVATGIADVDGPLAVSPPAPSPPSLPRPAL